MVNNLRRRIARTIPFGYKVSENKNILIPIHSQLKILESIKIKIIYGDISLRDGTKLIKKKTGRSLSHIGLNNIIKKENPYWSKKLREKEKRQREEKKKFLEIKKIEKKKQKEIDRLSKLSSQNRVNKRCICCNEIKILNDFQKLKRYRASYCKNCYKLILLNSPKISVKCSSCKKNKSLSELYGTKPIKAFQRRTCIICEMRNRKIWRINNIEKVLKAKRRYNLRKNELVSNKKSLW